LPFFLFLIFYKYYPSAIDNAIMSFAKLSNLVDILELTAVNEPDIVVAVRLLINEAFGPSEPEISSEI